MQRLAHIIAESRTAFAAQAVGNAGPADAHLAGVPLERIRRITSELQQRAGADIDDIDEVTMSLLLNDYRTSVAHLRAVARLAEQGVTAAAASIQEASLFIEGQLKLAEAARREALDADRKGEGVIHRDV
jgi:hypothetical protein